jgi:SAM-dependent methyltransferase
MTEKSYSDLRCVSKGTRAVQIPSYMEPFIVNHSISVLDVGCGNGKILKALQKRGLTSIKGVDIDSKAVADCMASGLDVRQIKSISQYAEEKPGPFDLILMNHVLEHIRKDEIIITLGHLRNMLSSRGKLVVTAPNAQSPTGCYWAYEDFTHNTIFTSGSLYFVLKSAGFTHVELLDQLGLDGQSTIKRLMKRPLLELYRLNRIFWNKVTNNSYHLPSPDVFTFEIKMVAHDRE